MSRLLRVAIVHNRYQEPGGEDIAFEFECALLQRAGHYVVRFELHNDAIHTMRRHEVARKAIWNRDVGHKLKTLFRHERIDVVHVHNTLPLVSPAVYAAARNAGAAVVQTLHNYRSVCPAATLYRDGRPCEACVGKPFAWPGIRHVCYRHDMAASATVAATLVVQRLQRRFGTPVDCYIALTQFAKSRYVAGGLPADRIRVKPNSTDRPPSRGPSHTGPALFAGRLSEEKGLAVMLEAWRNDSELPVARILGDGPMRDGALELASTHPHVEAPGRVPRERMSDEFASASMLVFPSIWYECFPMTIVEAFAVGLPVIASRLGSIAEIVEDGRTGLHFEPGDAADLATKVRWLRERPEAAARMGAAARETFESDYSPERNLQQLEAIYAEARRVAPRSAPTR